VIYSMTGYGFCENNDEQYQCSIEIKTYNNRFLDISLNMPPVLNPLEERLREKLRSRLGRGRVDVSVRFRDLSKQITPLLDAEGIKAYAQALRQMSDLAELNFDLRLEHFLSQEGLVRLERNRDFDAWWQRLEPCLDTALDQLIESRAREGRAIQADLENQLKRLEASQKAFESNAGLMEGLIREGMQKRFEEVLGDKIDQDRVLAEIAVQLARLTINEEIVRFASHIAGARHMLAQGTGIGKKLDFLCQELNREINTIGSKSAQLDLSNAVIEAKDALENLREQLRNVE